MRKIVLLPIIILLATSCKKKVSQFYVDYNSQVVIYSTIGQAIPVSLYTPEITTNAEAEFESNNTNKERIESIFLKDLKMKITSPSGETFSFLNSVEIYISSTNHAEVKVAYKDNIPANVGSELSCDLVEVDLQNYVKDDKFKIRVQTVTDETIPQDVHVDVYSNFFVDAKWVK